MTGAALYVPCNGRADVRGDMQLPTAEIGAHLADRSRFRCHFAGRAH